MQSQYADKVQFFIVYTSEAHAADSDRPAGKDIEQPVTTEERREVAVKFLDDMELGDMPALLDNIDNKTSQDYASLPDRLYLIGKDGKIAYAGDKGPRGFKPDELQQAIDDELGGKTSRGASNRNGNSRGAPRENGGSDERMARMLSRMPAFGAINKDGDDQLSADEIKAASESLLTLDKNGDGELTADELRPSRRRR